MGTPSAAAIAVGSSSFLVQAEVPKGEKASDFSEIETMPTFFVDARLGAF